MGEKIVYIRRVEKNDKTRLPKDLLSESKKTLGPTFNHFGQIMKGVTDEEERKILPGIIAVSVSDATFAKRAEDFWANITINVPTGRGTPLNVFVESDGVPSAPLDYVKYKFALKHKHVILEEKIEDNPTALYYIHDPATASEKQKSGLKLRNEAKLKYLELIQDEDKMNAILAVMTNYRNPKVLTSEDKQVILEGVSVKTPKEFIDTLKDTKITMKAFIYRAIDAGILKEAGKRIIYDNDSLGEDIGSVIAFLTSKEGSGVRVQLEGKLSEWELKK
jgi:hypothetical protein